MRQARPGFTLIEFLIALSLWALVAVSLTVTFRAGLVSYQRSQREGRWNQEARAILEQMARELRNATLVPDTPFIGKADSITFTTIQSPSEMGEAAAPQLAAVSYGVGEAPSVSNDQRVFVVQRREQLLSQGSDTPQIVSELSATSAALTFEYAYQAGGSTESIRWEDRWTHDEALPSGIRAALLFRPENASQEVVFRKTFWVPFGKLFVWQS